MKKRIRLWKMQRKSAIELNFQFFLGIIIIIAVLLLGYKGIEMLSGFFRDNTIIQLRSDLESAYERSLNLGRGSLFNQSIAVPIGELCFFDSEKSGNLVFMEEYKEALEHERNNVFLMQKGKLTPLLRMNLNLAQKEVCFKSNGWVKLSFESLGDSVNVK
ncbi:MAG TPA: hypothetical protein ENN46_00260 [Candidatus Woesearchaeota archaeon]|nr:hypothetical protein [Candidatus Woesearchaeota archaeon]